MYNGSNKSILISLHQQHRGRCPKVVCKIQVLEQKSAAIVRMNILVETAYIGLLVGGAILHILLGRLSELSKHHHELLSRDCTVLLQQTL